MSAGSPRPAPMLVATTSAEAPPGGGGSTSSGLVSSFLPHASTIKSDKKSPRLLRRNRIDAAAKAGRVIVVVPRVRVGRVIAAFAVDHGIHVEAAAEGALGIV